jgi:two-component sensor histidine kinase
MAWRWVADRPLGSVAARLVALIGLAAIPVVFMAGTIAWQNQRLVANRAIQNAVLIREAQVARHQAAIDGAEQMLAAISQSSTVRRPNASNCDAMLAGILAAQPWRYSNLEVINPDGSVVCSALPLPGAQETSLTPWLMQVRHAETFTIGPVERLPVPGDDLIFAAYPVRDNQKLIGILMAGLRLDWLSYPRAAGSPAARSATWLFERQTGLVATGNATAAALPPAPLLSRLLRAEQGTAMGRSRGGTEFAYAVEHLTPDLSLLVGYQATAELLAARNVLVGRIIELGLLLAVGLLAVWFGAAVGVVQPLARLTQSVGRWRAGGKFDPGPARFMPTEISSLAASFSEATASLNQRERQLRTALALQELLMQEIHHRVKNNLQIVASLLNLQASRIRVPAARAEFQAARDRVHALATLHRHLYARGELHAINMRSFLLELCGQLFQALGEQQGGRISLAIEASELSMSSDQAVPLSLIVTEAVTNSVKYAFPGGRSGHVKVLLSATDAVIDLEIQDDGVGIRAGRMETETGPRDGIGIQLIRGFARQLGASLVVEEGSGTKYHVAIPRRHQGGTPAEKDIAASTAEVADQPT